VAEASEEAGAETIAEADGETGDPVPVPGPVMPAGVSPACELSDVAGTAALPEALPADGTLAGDVEGVETSEIGTFVVI